jgi:hypothetical protein
MLRRARSVRTALGLTVALAAAALWLYANAEWACPVWFLRFGRVELNICSPDTEAPVTAVVDGRRIVLTGHCRLVWLTPRRHTLVVHYAGATARRVLPYDRHDDEYVSIRLNPLRMEQW